MKWSNDCSSKELENSTAGNINYPKNPCDLKTGGLEINKKNGKKTESVIHPSFLEGPIADS